MTLYEDGKTRLEYVEAFSGDSETEIFQTFFALDCRLKDIRLPIACYIEKVGYIKGDGPMGSFTFGKVYGFLRGMVTVLGWPIYNVYPAVWQGRLGCLTGGNKRVTLNRAKEMYGHAGLKITHATADAILIAHYGAVLEAAGRQ